MVKPALNSRSYSLFMMIPEGGEMSRWLKGALQKKQGHENEIQNEMQAPGHGPGWGSSGEGFESASDQL